MSNLKKRLAKDPAAAASSHGEGQRKTMAVFYKLYQSKRTGKSYDKWYARATQPTTVDLEKIADIVQQNCSLKRSDVKAVLSELVEVMTDQLQAGNRVKLDGFGTFKIGLRSKGANAPEEFSVQRHVVSAHVLFLPQARVGADGKRVKTFLAGVKVQELPDYPAPAAAGGGKDDPSTPVTPGGGTEPGDQTP